MEAESAVDSIMRCDSCQKLVRLEMLHKLGCCDSCGNKRVRSVLVLSDDERALVAEWGDQEFLTLFEQADE